jgi:hypothetical protein
MIKIARAALFELEGAPTKRRALEKKTNGIERRRPME